MLEQQGISAVKLNYSNKEKKNVTLKLVKNRSALEYTSTLVERPNNLIKRIFKSNKTTLPLSKFYGLVFGGNTSIFKHRKIKLFLSL